MSCYLVKKKTIDNLVWGFTYNLVVCLLSYTTRKIVNSLPEMQNLLWE